jgi:hypothetical protein
MVEFYPFLFGILEGVALAHLGLHAIGAVIAVAIFLLAMGRSPVNPMIRLAGLAGALGSVLFYSAALGALLLLANWAQAAGNTFDLYAVVVSAAAMAVYVLFQVMNRIEIARLSAWDSGFAEELMLTPWRKRALLLRTWSSLRHD